MFLLTETENKFRVGYFLLVVILFIPVFSNQLFFLLAGILGYSYGGSSESSIFVIYTLAMLLLSVVIYLVHLLFSSITLNELTFFFFLSIFLTIAISLSLIKDDDFFLKELAYFIILGLPGAFVGLAYYKIHFKIMDYSNFKYFKYFIVLISYLFIFAVIRIFFDADSFADLSLGGASYQFISYTAALLFGLSLYSLHYRLEKDVREERPYLKFLILLLLLPLFFLVFLTGSKGAALLIVLYSLLFSVVFLAKKALGFFIFSAVSISATVLVIGALDATSVFNIGLDRILLIFDSDSSFETRSSGRLEYYDNFITLLKSSPFFGYGPFISNGYVTNSHNFFSMVLLNFGTLLGTVFILLNLTLLANFFLKLKFSNSLFGLQSILLLYLFVQLSFSGSYLKNPIYWFVFAILFCMTNFRKKQI